MCPQELNLLEIIMGCAIMNESTERKPKWPAPEACTTNKLTQQAKHETQPSDDEGWENR